MDKKVLVSVSTFINEDWERQIDDIKRFGIKEFAVFFSATKPEERIKIMAKLRELGDVKIPFIHANPTMTPKEIEFLFKNYGLKYFNLHSTWEFPLIYDYDRLRDKILIENNGLGARETDIEGFGGLCLDLSHLEHERLLNSKEYQTMLGFIERYPILANHISAVTGWHYDQDAKEYRYDNHTMSKFEDFDYLKKFPLNYFSNFIAIEVSNSIPEQLEVKKYIEEIIRQAK